MNEHVVYELDMFNLCHAWLRSAPNKGAFLKFAVHEAFYVHMKNLLLYFGPAHQGPDVAEYMRKIHDQILTLGPARTPSTNADRLRTRTVCGRQMDERCAWCWT